jgi:hypothetical protein
MRVLGLVMGLVSSAAGCGSGYVAVQGPAGAIDVPADVLDRIRVRVPGAEPTPGAGCAGGSAAGASQAAAPGVLTADVNGDDIQDVVLRVENGAPRLFASFGRLDQETVTLIEITGQEGLAPGGILIRPKGTKYLREEWPGLDFYFSADTVVVAGCDGTETAYVWTGTVFEPQRVGGKAGAPS